MDSAMSAILFKTVAAKRTCYGGSVAGISVIFNVRAETSFGDRLVQLGTWRNLGQLCSP